MGALRLVLSLLKEVQNPKTVASGINLATALTCRVENNHTSLYDQIESQFRQGRVFNTSAIQHLLRLSKALN